MIVEDILRTKGRKVHTVETGQTVVEAVELLNGANIGALVVLDAAGDLAGILSERDIVRRLSATPAALMTMKVGDCMTGSPHTCRGADTIDQVMMSMTEKRIRHLPVHEDGQLLGLISIGDVVKRKIEEIEHEAASLRDYIAS